jgi:hypothetical protein
MKKLALAVGLAATLFATAAQAMSVEEFLATAARIPRNATAMLHPATHRLVDEVKAGFRTIRAEQRAAVAAGRQPAACIPERVALSPEEVLARLQTVPANRRSISVVQALREWMAERYPCS